ncbi:MULTISPECIES: hypothetical protein [Prevotella]|nr:MULTISPECIES: hypothetical protein [Prevotella]
MAVVSDKRNSCQVYNDLWKETNLWAQEHLEGEELDYFYEVTD